MGSSTDKRSERRLAPLCTRHGHPYQAQIPTTRPDLRGRSKSVTYARTSSRRRRKLAKMRQPAGLPVEDAPMAPEDEEAKKRRKVLQEALEMDKDADSDEGDGDGANDSKGNANGDRGGEEEDRGDDDEEDVTTELLRELEKIKRERAAEHARVEQAEAEATEAEREARIATANPLLNLSAALGNAPGINTTAPGTFALKRRWDDDLVFKNQAKGDKDKGLFGAAGP